MLAFYRHESKKTEYRINFISSLIKMNVTITILQITVFKIPIGGTPVAYKQNIQ